ncbi:pilus assembly protein [Undibacterium sp. Di24W]|uniref:pilus assembly protein n=1 Tax=Undibacterium sp. Di24W TaxID=3413033 RepID=UPI003BF42F8A
MIRMPNRLLRPLALVLATAQVLLPLTANAGISQLPPLVKPNVPPNVFYTLDDSGSMMFEVMPEDLTPFGDNRDKANGGVPGKTWTTTGIGNYCNGNCAVRYSFPPPGAENTVNSNLVYSPGGGYTGRGNATVVGFGDNITVARWRSAVTNKMYYNPAVRYDPWVDASKIDSNNPSGLPMAPASKTAAKFNPVAPTGGTNNNVIDLTQNATRTAHWLSDDSLTSPSTATAQTFFPATYYVFQPRVGLAAGYPLACTGVNVTTSNLNCFTRIEIRTSPSTYAKAATRTDCTTASTTCSYEEEIQNFANWFQFYRSKILMARGGSAAAFANQPSSLRVGFGTINTGNTVVNRISDDFSDTNKKDFINTLFTKPITPAGTPLIKSLDEVGQYFSGNLTGYKGINSPWQTKFGVGNVTDQASCRQNFNVLMTDGYWSAGDKAATNPGNWDNTIGDSLVSTSGATYQYNKEKPYVGATSDTLADIAFYYWSKDMRTDMPNNVPTSRDGVDVAFWQHLVQFTVGLGVFGSLDPVADLPALKNGNKSWPDPTQADAYKVDDLWHAAVNSRGKYFSASNPTEFADALKNALNEIAARSGDAAAIATSNNTLGAGVKLYTATYRTGDWSGRLEQKSIFYNSSNPADPNNGTVSSTNDWDTDLKKPVPTSRNIVTSAQSGTGGLDFSYANLFSVEKAKFDTAAGTYGNGTQIVGEDIFNYVRGETSKEGTFFRRRAYWLGDLVNSDPQYVGTGQDHGYSFLPPGSYGKTFYQAYLNAKKTRAPTVYVGSNDGMLHAFDATSDATTGGTERFAFVPKAVVGNLPELAKPSYVHRFFVDGTPAIGDAALGSDPTNPWRTILVGTTGAGAKSIFALDITDPTSFTKDKVKWERSATGDDDLGYTIGVPQIGRLKDGRWVTVFGNGFSSINGAAVLYVVDLNNGNVIQKIPTGVGSSGSPNGLSTPKLRIGADSTIQAAYAGDIQGNLWKFDFTTPGTGTTTGALAFGNAKPLFVATNAVDASGRRQPITTQPQLYQHPVDGYMVVFGTGKIFEDNDPSTTDLETLYGVWDKATATQVTKTQLVQQVLSISNANTNFYEVTKNPVDWNSKRGWYLTLNQKSGERLVTDPNIFEDQAIFTTLIPGVSTDLCANDSLSATLQISALNGAALSYQTIDTNGDGVINTSDALVSGRLSSSTLGTTIIRTGNRNLKLYQAASKDGALVNSSGTPSKGSKLIPTARLWRQLLNRQ